MNKIFRLIFIFGLVFIFGFQNVIACTIEIAPLRKQFRGAKAVFIGKVVKISQFNPTETEKLQNVPENWRDMDNFSKITIEAQNKWKGSISSRKDFIGVIGFPCGCDSYQELKENKTYLFFVYEKNFLTICDAKESDKDWVKKEMKRLNNFGFRLWSRIYPF
jgi:hypothetical protein